jgi:hypothetical protein
MSTQKKTPGAGDGSGTTKINEDSTKPNNEKEQVIAAHDEAEADIEKDPDMELPTRTDDLDEGELANLGGDKNDLI